LILHFSIVRAEKLIRQIVKLLNLRLDNLTVLTEAGSNYFIFSSLIAYYANAAKIFVWIKDTNYGLAKEIEEELKSIIKLLNLDLSRFEFALNKRPSSHIRSADIITNLGVIRPIDRNFLNQLKVGAVVSYMCEGWEVRPDDVDLDFCKNKGIKIAGVWENHPDLMIFNGCGPLAVKLCFEAGLEVYQNRILIISADKFGQTAAESFKKIGASSVKISKPTEINQVNFSDFDLIFVADYSFEGEILGHNVKERLPEFKNTAIVHLCGGVDYKFFENSGITCYPHQQGFRFRMTKTLAHLGLKPVIDLHASGLKVGECLYNNQESDLVQFL
jgi:hypothetical protein